MCTVTFIARKRGYALGMNRDEQLSRPKGLPPRLKELKGRRVISPSEPGGGTWIALNGHGNTLALINWYSVKSRAGKNPVSRGKIIDGLATTASADEVDSGLRRMPLARTNPFRLIGFFPATCTIVEWRWNLKSLQVEHHPWRTQQWISSGYDEPQAQRVRSNTFRSAGKQASFGSLDWLRRLHRSHQPRRGPFSTCMHRSDAATVSYTEVNVSGRQGVLRYHGGAPCTNAPESTAHLRLRS